MDKLIVLLVGALVGVGAGVASGYFMFNDGGYDNGYDAGYDAGYDKGYDAGYDAGKDAGSVTGYAAGYSVGYAAGQTAEKALDQQKYDAGYNAGLAAGLASGTAYGEGFQAGYGEGYDLGYNSGFAAGYNAGLDDGYDAGQDGTKTRYWFYLDFGGESSEYENMWVSAYSDNVVDGLISALTAAGVDHDIGSTGWITSIGDVENGDWDFDEDALEESLYIMFGPSWMNWFWSSESMSSTHAWSETAGLDVTLGTIFYIGFTNAYYDMGADSDMYPVSGKGITWSALDPNGVDLNGTGPFDGSAKDNVSDTPQTYWFYLDFGGESSTYSNMWIYAVDYDVISALFAAIEDSAIGTDYVIGSTGWITSIGDVENGDWDFDEDALEEDLYIMFGPSWMNWFWSSESMSSTHAWSETAGLDVTLGTIFYIGFTNAYYDMGADSDMYPVSDNGITWSALDPNGVDLSGTGPFV